MKISTLAASLTVLLGAGPALSQEAAAPQAVLTMSPFIERTKIIEVMIDGQPARMMFDTGAGITTISPDLARRIGCTPHGLIVGHRLTGQAVQTQKCGEHRVTVGGHEGTADLAVLDPGSLLPPGTPQLDGFIGLDALDGAVITLDLADNRLILETMESLAERIGDDPGAPLRRQRESGGRGLTVFAPIEAQVGSLWFLVDSGNMANIMVPPETLEQWGFTPDEARAAAASGAPTTVPLNILAAPRSPERVRVREMIHDGVLNEGLIAAYEVTLDLANDRIWYRPAR